MDTMSQGCLVRYPNLQTAADFDQFVAAITPHVHYVWNVPIETYEPMVIVEENAGEDRKSVTMVAAETDSTDYIQRAVSITILLPSDEGRYVTVCQDNRGLVITGLAAAVSILLEHAWNMGYTTSDLHFVNAPQITLNTVGNAFLRVFKNLLSSAK